MPLTRHFYALDEVQSALYFTAGRYDAKEALFWSYELIQSGCAGECVSGLVEAWIWKKGPFCLAWLIEAWSLRSDEVTEDAIGLATFQLCSSKKRDHSLWNILVLSSADTAPDRITPKTPPVLPLDINDKERYFLCAAYQGKAQCAWWISTYMPADRVWWLIRWYITHIHVTYTKEYNICLEALQGYEQLLGYRSDAYDVILRCLAVLSICLSPLQQRDSFAPLPATLDQRCSDAVKEWTMAIGRKARRQYPIPTACLYGVTQRGCLRWTDSTLRELHDVQRGVKGCPFWDEVVLDDSHFPDDLPDEWTLAEKKKSHGDGVLGPQEQVTLFNYARTHLAGPCRLAWNTTKQAQLILEKCGIRECRLTSLTSIISLDKKELANPLWLIPVKKRLIL